MDPEKPSDREQSNVPRVLVREVRPAGAAWEAGRQFPPRDETQPLTALVVLPAVASELLLQRFALNRFTWLRLWGDLRRLNNRVINEEFKVFVYQRTPEHEPPRLFLCTLARGSDRDGAYAEGVERLMRLVTSLTRRIGYGFDPLLHEVIIFPLTAWAAPEQYATGLSIRDIHLVVCEGRISAILTPLGYALERAPFHMVVGPGKGIITTFVEIPKYEADLAPTITVQSDIVLQDFESQIAAAMLEHAPEISGDHLHSLTLLYNAALSMESVPIGFLLLWQVLESAASARDFGGTLLPERAWEKLESTLEGDGLDDEAQARIRGALSGLRQKGQNLVIAEMLREHVYPERELESLIGVVRAYQKTRGGISHPNAWNRDQLVAVMGQYIDLRKCVGVLIRRLSEPACK